MSAIDLVILVIVLEKPQSAYNIQKDVELSKIERKAKKHEQKDAEKKYQFGLRQEKKRAKRRGRQCFYGK